MSIRNKIITVIVGLSLVAMMVPSGVAQAVLTEVQIQSILNLLTSFGADTATVTNVETSLRGGTPATTPTTPTVTGIPAGFTFTKTLKMGDVDQDVVYLKIVLASEGCLSGVSNTTLFGSKTKAAVQCFQQKYGTGSQGTTGTNTRVKLNALIAGGIVTPVTPVTPVVPTGTGLTVGLASDTPVAAVVASGTAFNRAVKANLTAGTDGQVKVTGVTITKSGLSTNTVFTGFDIVDGSGVRHGNVASSLTADNTVTFSFASNPIVVPAGSTGSLTARFNNGTGTGGTVKFDVTAITTDGAAVTGLPIYGNTMTLTTGTSIIATVVLDEKAVNASGVTLNVNPTTVQEIAKFSVQESSSSEDIKLHSLIIFNIGTAADSDYKDVELVAQDGIILATAQPVNKYVTFDLSSSPYTISKGLTKNFTIRAKIVDGTSRTIQFEVYNDYDLAVKGVSSATFILPTTTTGGTAGTGTSFPTGNTTLYNKVTIGSGTLTFNKSSDSPSAAVSIGDQNVLLAKYDIKANGEDMEIRQLKLYIKATDITTTDQTLSGTVFVKYNDATIWSGAYSTTSLVGTGALSDSLLVALSLSSYPVMTAGQAGNIKVVGTINSSAEANDTVQVRLDCTSVKRLVTNDISDLAVTSADGNQITVKGLGLVVTTLATPVANSVVAGTTGFELARIDLDASTSGEDARVSTIKIADTMAGTGSALTDIANLVLYDAADPNVALQTTTTTSVNVASNTFTFAAPLTVSKTAVKHLILKGDVVALTGTSGTETHTFYVAADADITATGAITGNTLGDADKSFVGTGQARTIVSAGTLTVSLLSGTGKSPSVSQNIPIGTQGGIFLAFKLTSQYEAQKVTSLKLSATGSGSTKLSVKDLTNIGLYADSAGVPAATPFATASQFACTSGECTKTWTAADNLLPTAIQPGVPQTVYVKANVSGEGTVILGDDFVMSIKAATDVVSKGAFTGTTASSNAGTAIVTNVSYIVPFTVSVDGFYPIANTSTTTTIGAGSTLARFKVTNNGSAQITLTHGKFYDAGTHTGSTTPRYTAYASSENSNDFTTTTLEASAADEVSHVLDFSTFATTTVTINGGAYRYITIELSTKGTVTTGDTFAFSIASLGDLKYKVTEGALGYDADGDGALTSATEITSLPISGTPVVGTWTSL